MVDLSKGLLVENMGFLIPWGITNEEAWQIGNPNPYNLPDDKTRMVWENAVILGGLECTVQVYFPTANSKLSVFNIFESNYNQQSPEDWADILRARCDVVFGEQTNEKVWVQDDVSVRIEYDGRYDDFYSLKISKRT